MRAAASETERIAVLEQQQRSADKGRDELASQVHEIRKDVAEIKQRLSGWRGFFGGFTFALTTLGGLIGAALMSAWHALTNSTGGN